MNQKRKRFLWFLKLGFVLLCLLIWGASCVPLAKSILPAFYDQCVYHEFAEKFLEEKYGKHINVHNERLPLSEMNAANFMDYRYNFMINGKTYQFLYYIGGFGDGDVFYGDNVQSEELYQLVDGAIDIVRYSSTISDFTGISWDFSKEVIQPYHLVLAQTERDDRMFMTKYTGDNLQEFPIRIFLYGNNATVFDGNKEKLEEMYKSVTEDFAQYDVTCKEISIYKYKDGKKIYMITETSEGIKIEEY